MLPTIDQIKPLISRRTKGIITTLAITVNLLIIAFFLLIQLDLNDNASFINHIRRAHSALKKKHAQKEWAKIRPKTSQLGAPVVLMQSPQQTVHSQSQPSQPQQTKQNKSVPSFNKPPEKSAVNGKEKTVNQEQNIEDKKDSQKTKQLEPTELAQNIDTSQSESDIQEKKSSSLEHVIKAALAKKLKEPAHKDSSIEKPITGQQNKPTTIKKQNTQTNPTQIIQDQEKQKLTFAQLVKGFTEHLKTEGEYTLSMEGKSSAKATEQQLRVGRFLQKIIQCVQTAWKVNRNRYPLNHRVIATIVVRVVINKDGSLGNLIIQQTTGRQILDTYILNILKDASKSFPPIPHYLNQEVCVITCNWEKIPLPEGPISYTITR